MPPVKPCLVKQLRRQGLSVGLGLCLILCMAPARSAESVLALRYGATLFHFYQQDYFAALTELMAAQQLRQLNAHADNAELLRGGISLAYGMDIMAEQIFLELLEDSSDAVDRDQAWFYLAKMTWQRGQLSRAMAALAQMSPDYQGDHREEADYLRGLANLRLGDEPLAADFLQQLPEDSPWRYYLYYNLGAAQAARGEWRGAVDHFRQLGPLRRGTQESRSLRDKALTASGFALMAAGDFEQAGSDFTRVRLDSPMSDRALLGYGWASVEQGDYLAALSPWQALAGRSLLNDGARESLLAIPYAYEKLGKHGSALDSYQSAAQQYASELERLQAAIEVFQVEPLQPLLGLGADDEGQQWLFGGDILPVGEHVPYLGHLLTRHSFQLAMRELRDLYSMEWHLADARHRLSVLQQVDGDQQQSWSAVMNGNRRELLQQRQQDLHSQVQSLRQRVEKAEENGDTRALATVEQLARWERLDHALALAGRLDTPDEKLELLQLYRGLLIWEDSENYPAQSWQLKRQLRELETLAHHTRKHLEAVDQAIAHRHQADFAPRIAALEQRVGVEAERVQRAILAAETRMRTVAVAELERQAGNLTTAMGQSRLAVARLYDLASPEVPR